MSRPWIASGDAAEDAFLYVMSFVGAVLVLGILTACILAPLLADDWTPDVALGVIAVPVLAWIGLRQFLVWKRGRP